MSKLKIGIIGAGGIADRRSIPGMMLSDRISVVAVMDSNMETCEKVRKKYGIANAYSTHETLLKDPDVEAVYIASPVFCHYDQVIAAADAGKQILCEKPFALNAAQAEEMERYCRERNVLLYAGFVMRFHRLHQNMKKIVQSGALGDIVNAYANFSCWYPDNGSWRQKKENSGGGVLMDMAVHSIDMIEFITGKPIARVSAMTRTRAFHYEVDDSASLLMELQNGGTSTVNSYFCIPDEASMSRLEIYGTKGALKAEGTLSQTQSGILKVVLLADGVTRVYEEKGNEDENIYKMQFEGFCDAIEGKPSNNADARQMVAVQKIVEAAYRSSDTGLLIDLN